MECLHQTLPHRAQAVMWKRRMMIRVRGMNDFKETMSSRHNRMETHVNSQRLWQRAQGPYRFKPDEVPGLRE